MDAPLVVHGGSDDLLVDRYSWDSHTHSLSLLQQDARYGTPRTATALQEKLAVVKRNESRWWKNGGSKRKRRQERRKRGNREEVHVKVGKPSRVQGGEDALYGGGKAKVYMPSSDRGAAAETFARRKSCPRSAWTDTAE